MATRTWTLKIKGDATDAVRAVGKLQRKLRDFKVNEGLRTKLDTMGKEFDKQWGSITSRGKSFAVVAGTAFSANFIGGIVSGLASGAAKVAHGVASIGALLPAAAVAGALAFGALKIAVSGVGDALKAGLAGDTEAWNEAMKGLSQSGQEFARAVASLRPELDGLKKSVQENFFEQFDERVRRLALTWLPILENNLKLVARGFGEATAESMKILQSREVVSRLGEGISNARVAVRNLTAGIPNLVAAFIPLVSVGTSFLPNLTGGFEGATARLADFMREAERTGDLRRFIQSGLDKLHELWETTKQIGRIFEDLAGIANKVFPGIGGQAGGMLDIIERGVDSVNRFLETARGNRAANTVFQVLGDLVNAFFGTLQHLGEMLARVFGPILPDVAEFLSMLTNLKFALITAVEAPLKVLAAGLGIALRGLSRLFQFISENKVAMAALRGVVIALFLAWAVGAAQAAVATLLATWPLLAVGAAVGVLAYLFITHFDTIKAAVETAFNWVRDNWPMLVAILTGPMAPVILLFITHFEKIKAIFMGFVDIVLALWDRFGSTIMTYVRSVWDAIWQIIQGAFDIIRGIFTVFAALFTGDWSRAWEGVKMILSGVWQVIQGIVSLAVAQVRYVVGLAWQAIQAVTGIVWNAILATLRFIWSLITAVVRGAIAFVTAILTTGWNLIKATVSTVWGAIKTTITTVWDGIKTAVGNAIDWVRTRISNVLDSISSTWSTIWGGMSSALGAIWDGIRAGVRGGANAVIGVINWFIRLLNNIPGVSITPLGTIGGAAPRQRTGAQEHQAQRRARGGFMTNRGGRGAEYVVGEGNRFHPEAVIATDPRYRKRNRGLVAWAAQKLGMGNMDARGGIPGFAIGGIPNPIDAAGDAVRSAGRGVQSAVSAATDFARDVTTRALGPVRDAAKGMIDRIPGGGPIDWLRGGVKNVIDQMYNWARGKTDEHERAKAAVSMGGGGGSTRGLVGAAASAFAVFRRMFPGMTIGGWRARGSVPGSDHPKGKALDLMTTSGAVAQRIISTFLGQPGRKYWIWNRQIANAPGFSPRGYSGPSPHTDHVHLSYFKKGGIAGYRNGGIVDVPGPTHPGEMVLRPGDQRQLLRVVRSRASGDGTSIVVQGNIVIHANSYEEGREAMRGARDYLTTLEERRIMSDARSA